MSKRIKFESNNLFVTLSRGTLRVLDRETNTTQEWVARSCYTVSGTKGAPTFTVTVVHGEDESIMLFPITKHWNDFRKESRDAYAKHAGPTLARRLKEAEERLAAKIKVLPKEEDPEAQSAQERARAVELERLSKELEKVRAEARAFSKRYDFKLDVKM